MRSIFAEEKNGDGSYKCFVEIFDEIPEPLKHEVVVKVVACSLSFTSPKEQNDLLSRTDKKFLVGEDVAGTVIKVGSEVSHVAVGDHIIGILPLTAKYPGCSDYCVFQEYDIVKKPDSLSFEDAAAGIGECVKAYTTLHYHGRICSGDTVLVIDAASPFGIIATQLAQLWGTKVIATVSSQAEKSYLESLHPPVGQIIEASNRTGLLVSSVMEETGGCGVDCIIDNGVRLFNTEEDKKLMNEVYKFPVLHKHEIISCLGYSGRWITSHSELQLDPPDSQQLHFRGASINFLFPQAWILSRAQQGRYQHILEDAADKLGKGLVRTKIAKIISLDEVSETINSVHDVRIGKTVVKLGNC